MRAAKLNRAKRRSCANVPKKNLRSQKAEGRGGEVSLAHLSIRGIGYIGIFGTNGDKEYQV